MIHEFMTDGSFGTEGTARTEIITFVMYILHTVCTVGIVRHGRMNFSQ